MITNNSECFWNANNSRPLERVSQPKAKRGAFSYFIGGAIA